MKEKKTIYTNCDLDINKVKSIIEMLKGAGVNFTVIMSNYTTTIKSELFNFRFMKEEKSLLFFARTKELKKQVSNFLEMHSYNIDKIDSPKYYDIADIPDFIAPEIINIDLSSAYLYCLYNNQIIDRPLFDKLSQLPKQDRLGIVGMLASSKIEFSFNEKGEMIGDYKKHEDKDHRNIFFFCVRQTYFIMQEIKKIVGEDYIFTWVDGIYFKNGQHIESIQNFLDSINHPFKIDVLQNFEFYRNDKNIVEIDFLKNNKKKTFNIPIEKDNTFADELYKYINELNK